MSRKLKITLPPDLDAPDDLNFFGGTVEIDGAQAEAVRVAAGLLESDNLLSQRNGLIHSTPPPFTASPEK